MTHHAQHAIDLGDVAGCGKRLHQRGVRADGGSVPFLGVGSARVQRRLGEFKLAAAAVRGDARAVRRRVGPDSRDRHSTFRFTHAGDVAFVPEVRDEHVVQTRARLDALAAHRADQSLRGGFVVRRQKRRRRGGVRGAVRLESGRVGVAARL